MTEAAGQHVRNVSCDPMDRGDASIRHVAANIHAFDQRRVEERLSVLNAQAERLVAELAKG
jgi:hypothetical protein